MLKNLLIVPVLASAIISSSCTPQVVYIQPQVSIPGQPEYPRVMQDELACLSESAYIKLVERDAKKTAYIETLITLIENVTSESKEN